MAYRKSFEPAYFERLYSKDQDPWCFASSEYERAKYVATLEALQGQSFNTVFEIGCSIGIVTRLLAPHCQSLLAVDVSESALALARRNCAFIDNITISAMQIPKEWPEQPFDLILLSEVLYFLGPDDIRSTARKSVRALSTGGHVLLVNWLGETNYPCGGDESIELFLAETGTSLRPVQKRRNANYGLDLLTLIPT